MKKFFALLLFVATWAAAQTATPVSVTSIAVASGVVTVTTATAHGLAAGQGFCDLGATQGTDVVCSTVATVPTTTTFTYGSAAAVACATSCGTNQPAKRFIWDVIDATSDIGVIFARACIWNTTATPAPRPNGSSTCGSATPQENAAIAAGTTIEKVYVFTFPGNYNLTQANAFANLFQQSKQSAIAAAAQPGVIIGRFCDSTGCN